MMKSFPAIKQYQQRTSKSTKEINRGNRHGKMGMRCLISCYKAPSA